MRGVKTPADKDLEDAFLDLARRQRRDRSNSLLDEVDRLEAMDGADLIRREPLDFRRDEDPEFKRALRTAALLISNIQPEDVEYVAFRPVKVERHKRSIYVVLDKHVHRLSGSEVIVSESAWVSAWYSAGDTDSLAPPDTERSL